MTTTLNKPSILRSISALSLAALIVFGSMLSVAAAAANSDDVTIIENGEVIDNTPLFNYLSENGDYHVLSAFEITIKNNGEEKKIIFGKGTVADVLEKADISLKENQIVYPSANTKISGDVKITIYDAKPVKLTADGETKTVLLPYGNVEKAIKHAGIKLSEDDILSVSRNSKVDDISELKIQRVTYKEKIIKESIAYKSVKENSDKIDLGNTKLKIKGKNGEKLVRKRYKYVDGEQTEEKTLNSSVIKEPVDEVTLVGTKGAASHSGAGTFTDMNGVKVSYSQVLTGSGTAYTAPAGAGTATGVPAYYGGVAVNPNIIPYGSKLYIESTDGSFVYGYATAVDTGGALMDGSAIVDCFYYTYDECVNFGRRNVNIYVIG